MLFLKAITTDGKVELFNVSNILSIQHDSESTIKIVMGGGLYWYVKKESITYVNSINELMNELK